MSVELRRIRAAMARELAAMDRGIEAIEAVARDLRAMRAEASAVLRDVARRPAVPASPRTGRAGR